MNRYLHTAAGMVVLALVSVSGRAASVTHSNSADFATGTFDNLEDAGSGSSPSVQLVRDLFVGDGRDGAPPASGTISSGYARVSGTAGTTTISFADVSGASSIANGDYVLLHQSAGASGSSGHWEIVQIVAGGGNANGTWTLAQPLQKSYTYSSQWHVGPPCCPPTNANFQIQAQAVKIWQYTGGTISGTLTARSWDGRAGGILAFMSSGTLTISGHVHVNGSGGGSSNNSDTCCAGIGGGFRGGWNSGDGSSASRGEGHYGPYHFEDRFRNVNGGGGGWHDDYGNGGGGGNGTAGGHGEGRNGNNAEGGLAVGSADLSIMYFGGGGGGSKKNIAYWSAGGGAGGGIIMIFARTLNITGHVTCNGGAGGSGYTGGGGGAGGCVYLRAVNLSFFNDRIQTLGGNAGGSSQGYAGAGGRGRIRLDAGSSSGSIGSGFYGTLHTGSVPFMTSGTYTSAPLLLPGIVTALNTLEWTSGGSGIIRLRTRTSADGVNWSAWSGYLTTSGSQITSPVNSYIQYQAEFTAGGSQTPTLSNVTIHYTVNQGPSAPTALQAEGQTNPGNVIDSTPEFSAIHNDPDNDAAVACQIQVNTLPSFLGTTMWDSGKVVISPVASGTRGPLISYAGADLGLDGSTYYWRIRFWDAYDTLGPWSTEAAYFTMATVTEMVPQTINHQGVVAVNGTRFNGTGLFRFAIVNPAGTIRWSNDGQAPPASPVPLLVTDGIYATRLGDTSIPGMTALPAEIFAEADLRLRIWFDDGAGNGVQQLQPDHPLTSAAYCLRAGAVSPRSIGSAELANNAVNNFKLGSDPASLGKVSGGVLFSVGGNIGIGTASPGQKLDIVGGNGRVETGYGWLTNSDARFKKNVTPLHDVLDRVLKLRGVRFEPVGDSPAAGRGGHIGLVAQELEAQFPELVFTDERGFKCVDYGKIGPVLIEAIREQQTQIDEYRRRLLQQQADIEQLRRELDDLRREPNPHDPRE